MQRRRRGRLRDRYPGVVRRTRTTGPAGRVRRARPPPRNPERRVPPRSPAARKSAASSPSQRLPVRREHIGPPERHQRSAHVEQFDPGLDDADAGHVRRAVRGLAVPLLPGAPGRYPRLDHQASARPQCRTGPSQGPAPLLRVDDLLGGVAGDRREVGGERRQSRRVAVDPPHPLAARLAPRHVQGRRGGIDADDLGAAFGRRRREHPCPAADVEHLPRLALLRPARPPVSVAACPRCRQLPLSPGR